MIMNARTTEGGIPESWKLKDERRRDEKRDNGTPVTDKNDCKERSVVTVIVARDIASSQDTGKETKTGAIVDS